MNFFWNIESQLSSQLVGREREELNRWHFSCTSSQIVHSSPEAFIISFASDCNMPRDPHMCNCALSYARRKREIVVELQINFENIPSPKLSLFGLNFFATERESSLSKFCVLIVCNKSLNNYGCNNGNKNMKNECIPIIVKLYMPYLYAIIHIFYMRQTVTMTPLLVHG